MRSAHWLRGPLPKECSQTSLYAAVCHYGCANSRAMMLLPATTSAEALLSPESAQLHIRQRTEPLRNPVRPVLTCGRTPKAQSSKCGVALGESRASRNLSVHSSDQSPQTPLRPSTPSSSENIAGSAPGPGACPVSSQKISKCLILRSFHLPIINPVWRIIGP
jgi:hypothetical protein